MADLPADLSPFRSLVRYNVIHDEMILIGYALASDHYKSVANRIAGRSRLYVTVPGVPGYVGYTEQSEVDLAVGIDYLPEDAEAYEDVYSASLEGREDRSPEGDSDFESSGTALMIFGVRPHMIRNMLPPRADGDPPREMQLDLHGFGQWFNMYDGEEVIYNAAAVRLMYRAQKGAAGNGFIRDKLNAAITEAGSYTGSWWPDEYFFPQDGTNAEHFNAYRQLVTPVGWDGLTGIVAENGLPIKLPVGREMQHLATLTINIADLTLTNAVAAS